VINDNDSRDADWLVVCVSFDDYYDAGLNETMTGISTTQYLFHQYSAGADLGGIMKRTATNGRWSNWSDIGVGGSGGGGLSENEVKTLINSAIAGKADKPTLNTTSATSLILTHNQEARLGEIATLTLSMPETIDDLYWSSFCFASGATATSISYSGEPIIWCGDDCDADGSFIPEANTKYEVHIKKLGADIVARVGAY
jgi:hypothetical protein